MANVRREFGGTNNRKLLVVADKKVLEKAKVDGKGAWLDVQIFQADVTKTQAKKTPEKLDSQPHLISYNKTIERDGVEKEITDHTYFYTNSQLESIEAVQPFVEQTGEYEGKMVSAITADIYLKPNKDGKSKLPLNTIPMLMLPKTFNEKAVKDKNSDAFNKEVKEKGLERNSPEYMYLSGTYDQQLKDALVSEQKKVESYNKNHKISSVGVKIDGNTLKKQNEITEIAREDFFKKNPDKRPNFEAQAEMQADNQVEVPDAEPENTPF